MRYLWRTLILIVLMGCNFAKAASDFLTPDLISALPCVDTLDGVKTTAPFLLNPTTIVPVGSILRLFYIRPFQNDDPNASKFITSAPSENSYSRQGGGTAAQLDTTPSISPELKAALRAAHETVWPNIAFFRGALDLMSGVDLRLVYKVPNGQDLSDDTLSLIEGLLLGEENGAVTVLAIEKGSKAAEAGIVAGDRIDQFNDQPMEGYLSRFMSAYRTAQSTATIGHEKPYTFHLIHADGKSTDVSFKPPPSLGGSLLDQ